MKILFVYTDINVRGGAMSYQFGIGMVSAMLRRHGHETRLQYLFGRFDPTAMQRTILDWKPDIIAFSAVSPQYPYVRQALAEVRVSQFLGSGRTIPTLHANDPLPAVIDRLSESSYLDRALELFVENDLLTLPIVNDLSERKVLGLVRRFDISSAYLRHVHGRPASGLEEDHHDDRRSLA